MTPMTLAAERPTNCTTPVANGIPSVCDKLDAGVLGTEKGTISENMPEDVHSGDDEHAISATLHNRIETYRLFSRLFLKPLNTEEIDSLEKMELEKLARELSGTGFLAEGLNDMGRGLHRRHTGTTRLLGTDFAMCFDGVSSYEGLVATPYASIFKGSITGEKAVLYQEPRTKDLKAYRSEHVQADPDLHLPEDHISFELSFMADLSEKARLAYASDNLDETLRLIGVSQQFLENNILCWYEEFAKLALKILDTRFYRGVVKATHGYLLLDVTVLEDLRAAIS